MPPPTEDESREQFKLVASEAGQWEDGADGLFYSAAVLRDHLLLLVDRDPAGLRRVETLALVDSVMLLLGLAVENMVKGVLVARNPQVVSDSGLDISAWKKAGGKGKGAHGILGMVSQIIELSGTERDLLDRLQEHIVWAGRYPVPLRASDYHDSRVPRNKRSFTPHADFATAESIVRYLREKSGEAKRRQAAL